MRWGGIADATRQRVNAENAMPASPGVRLALAGVPARPEPVPEIKALAGEPPPAGFGISAVDPVAGWAASAMTPVVTSATPPPAAPTALERARAFLRERAELRAGLEAREAEIRAELEEIALLRRMLEVQG